VHSSNFSATAELRVAYSQSAEIEIAARLESADAPTDDIRASSNGGDDSMSKEGKDSDRALPLWLSDSIPNDFTVRMSSHGRSLYLSSCKYHQLAIFFQSILEHGALRKQYCQ
jgi:hypothetical protein